LHNRYTLIIDHRKSNVSSVRIKLTKLVFFTKNTQRKRIRPIQLTFLPHNILTIHDCYSSFILYHILLRTYYIQTHTERATQTQRNATGLQIRERFSSIYVTHGYFQVSKTLRNVYNRCRAVQLHYILRKYQARV